jgi:hypothetical protein
MGWGNLIGCTGLNPCDEDAPLYAERRVAAVAMAKNAGISVHLRLLVIES